MPSGTSSNASADATSLIVPSPPHASTSRAPRPDGGLRQLARVPDRFGHEDFDRVAVRVDDGRARARARARAAPRAGAARDRVDDDDGGHGRKLEVRSKKVEVEVEVRNFNFSLLTSDFRLSLLTSNGSPERQPADAVVDDVDELDDVGGDLRDAVARASRVSPSLTMNSCPSPEMKAMRTGPSAPASSAIPDSFSGGSGDGARRGLGERGRGAADRRRRRGAAIGAEREQIASRRARRSRRREPLVEPLDFARQLRAALFDRRLLRRWGRRNRVIRRRRAGEPRDERRASDRDRRRPLQIHAVIATDRSTRTFRVVLLFVVHPASTGSRVDSVPPLTIVAIIPARYASTRLPGKALADLDGRPMIEHVYRRVSAARGLSRGDRRDRRSADRDARPRLRRQGAADQGDARDRHRSARRSRRVDGLRRRRQRPG